MISAVASTSRGRSQDQLHVVQDEKRSHSQELVGRPQETRNWGGMIISIVVIILICAAIVTVAIIVSERMYLIHKFSFDDVFENSVKERESHFQWLNESAYISKDEENNLVKSDVLQNSSTNILGSRTWNVEEVSEFQISPTGTYILLVCRKEKEFQHIFTAIYKIYDVTQGKVLPALKPADTTEENPRLSHASWSPDKSHPSLIFIYKNNIYYQQEVNGTPKQITISGKENLIFNGVPDVAFQGLLNSANAIYWFSKEKRFIYGRFNDTGVDEAWVPKYDYLATPLLEHFPYPKPGGKLPSVSLHVVDLETYQTVDLTPPTSLAEQEHFFKYVVWINRFQVSVTWLNRLQDYSVVSICNTDTGSCTASVKQERKNGWVVHRGPPVFSDDGLGQSYALIWPLWDKDAKDNHYHVHVVTMKEGVDTMEMWTEGKFEVSKIIAYRKHEGEIYFLSNMKAIWDSHLYRVTLEEGITCISCDIHSTCSYYDAEAVPGTTKFILHCRGPGVPRSTLHDFRYKEYHVLENNTELYHAVHSKVFLDQDSQLFEVNDVKIPVRIMYHNKKDRNRMHPLLINVIDEPGSHMVKSEFYQGWFTYLASRYHVITANIDVRGTSGVGQNHLYAVNNKLGTVEVDDLIAVTEYLRNSSLGVVSFKNTQFDQNRIALIGWSYGGFLSTMAYARSPFFNCSIALAPITDLRYYEAVFAEKFMDLPTAEDNLQGYKNANISKYAHLFRNNTFMVAHGMADKTVHFQHSANLVKALSTENLQYQTLFYPDEGHDLWDSKISKNLHQSMTDFLVKCLKLDEEPT